MREGKETGEGGGRGTQKGTLDGLVDVCQQISHLRICQVAPSGCQGQYSARLCSRSGDGTPTRIPPVTPCSDFCDRLCVHVGQHGGQMRAYGVLHLLGNDVGERWVMDVGQGMGLVVTRMMIQLVATECVASVNSLCRIGWSLPARLPAAGLW